MRVTPNKARGRRYWQAAGIDEKAEKEVRHGGWGEEMDTRKNVSETTQKTRDEAQTRAKTEGWES